MLYQKTAPTSLAGTFKVPEVATSMSMAILCRSTEKSKPEPGISGSCAGGCKPARRGPQFWSTATAEQLPRRSYQTACWQQGSPRRLRREPWTDMKRTPAGRREGSRRQNRDQGKPGRRADLRDVCGKFRKRGKGNSRQC